MQDTILMIIGLNLYSVAMGIVLATVIWVICFILKGRRGDAYSLEDRQNY